MKKKNIFVISILGIFLFVMVVILFSQSYHSKLFLMHNADDESQRLEFFAQWMREDPLLFDPYVDQEKYDDAVARYAESMRVLLGNINGIKISPTDFIQKFGEASRSYGEFQGDASQENATALIFSIRGAQQAYAEDGRIIIESFESLLKIPGSEKKIAFLGGETTTDVATILDDLRLIQKNADALSAEIYKREKCLLESAEYCQKPWERFDEPAKKPEISEMPSILSKELLGVAPDDDSRGPYLVNSSCWNRRNHQWLYLVEHCGDLRVCSLQPFLADNRYYNTLGKAPFEKTLADMGVQIRPMGVTAPYACNDLEYRFELDNIDFFLKRYSGNRFFDQVSVSGNEYFTKIINDGKAAEKAFFDENYPSQNSLEYLGEYYLYAYNLAKQRQLLDQGQMNELLERGLLIKGKFVGTPMVIQTLSKFVELLTHKILQDGSVPPLQYVYVTKSAYSALFYSFSPSVWRIEDSLHFLDVGSNMQETFKMNTLKIMDYPSAEKQYGEQTLIDWTEKYKEVEKEEL